MVYFGYIFGIFFKLQDFKEGIAPAGAAAENGHSAAEDLITEHLDFRRQSGEAFPIICLNVSCAREICTCGLSCLVVPIGSFSSRVSFQI